MAARCRGLEKVVKRVLGIQEIWCGLGADVDFTPFWCGLVRLGS